MVKSGQTTRVSCNRAIAAVGLLIWLSASTWADDLPTVARSFIKAQCADCHDADSKKGNLDLLALPTQLDDPSLEARWILVHDRVQRGEMPPPKKGTTLPSQAERRTFLQSIGTFITSHDAARQAVGGRVILRRLNRTEYENTLHDLLKIDIPLADMLPEDATSNGFDNVAEALRLSVTQIDSYLQAADKALDAAIDLRADPRMHKRLSFLDIAEIRDALDKPNGITNPDGTKFQRLFDSRGDEFLLYINETFGPTLMRESHAPITGNYHVKVSLFAHQGTGHPVLVARWMANNFSTSRTLSEVDLTPGPPRLVEFNAWLKEGEMLQLSATGLTEEGPVGQRLRDVGAENYKGAGIGVTSVEIDGPLFESWPPPSVQQVFGDVPTVLLKKARNRIAYDIVPTHPTEDADRAITQFARRAFRRPVDVDVIAHYTGLARQAMDAGVTFQTAVRRACKAILTSPRFLFLQEERGTLDDYALAARLSYFLWSTTPDEELLQLASEKKLANPAVLRTQTDRLLNSPKAHEFTRNFCGQWLNLRDIDATMPDSRLYPEFDLQLKSAMIGETRAFFEEMLRRDLSVKTLIDSDFAMLNRRLAEHYDIPGVIGEQFRPVPLSPENHRGGILTQASILKVTANGTSTSPVVRGAFVERRILGYQLQPPPPNAGAIEPDTRGATTIREQLAKHRRMASCSVCHQYIDPPGFALESYDVIGGYRDWYRVQNNSSPGFEFDNRTTGKKVYVRKGPPVDPSGELTDGRAFSDLDQLKKLLLNQQESIARNLTNNLITYSTGAAVSFADRAAVDEILDKARPSEYGLRSLVHEIVQSPLFQTK